MRSGIKARLERLEQRAGICQDHLLTIIHRLVPDDELVGFKCNGCIYRFKTGESKDDLIARIEAEETPTEWGGLILQDVIA